MRCYALQKKHGRQRGQRQGCSILYSLPAYRYAGECIRLKIICNKRDVVACAVKSFSREYASRNT